jgi:hypothetical protein
MRRYLVQIQGSAIPPIRLNKTKTDGLKPSATTATPSSDALGVRVGALLQVQDRTGNVTRSAKCRCLDCNESDFTCGSARIAWRAAVGSLQPARDGNRKVAVTRGQLVPYEHTLEHTLILPLGEPFAKRLARAGGGLVWRTRKPAERQQLHGEPGGD